MKISGGQLTLDLKQGDTKETPEKLEGLLVLTKGSGEGGRTGYTVSASRGPNSAAAGGVLDPGGGSVEQQCCPITVSGGRCFGPGHRRAARFSRRRYSQPDAMRLPGVSR